MYSRWSSVLSYVAQKYTTLLKSTYNNSKMSLGFICNVTRSHSLFVLQYPYEKYGVDRLLSGGTQFPFGRDYAHPPD